jgi:hypothetical protein
VETTRLDRERVTKEQVEQGVKDLHAKIEERLLEKGRHPWASRHEVLGVITEEYQELIETVRNGGDAALCHELMDIAVAAIYGYINVKNGKTDW